MKVEINPQEQPHLFEPIPLDKLDLLTREELVILLKGERDISRQLATHVQRLEALNEELKQRSLLIQDQYITIKNKLFGKSSERSRTSSEDSERGIKKNKKKRILLPSERYPNLPLIERHVTLDKMPECSCCGSEMEDSGLREESEYLTKIPAQYYVVVQVRHKYACRSCHGDIKTAPVAPRIKEGSSMSDEMMVDVALSKYCDLIPIERQASIAGREGVKDLPPQSLIEATHYVADYVRSAYDRLGIECLQSKILGADETPHRMLEGDKKCHWFLWGFSTPRSSYLECHDTRSGDVAKGLLIKSKCEFLMSDVFSGYAKAVRETNVVRLEQGLTPIINVYCNAHARRYFKQALERMPEAEFFINQYKEIYLLEAQAKGQPLEGILKLRLQMRPCFEAIKTKSISDIGGLSEKSGLGRAMNYFLKNYEGLTRFLENPELPIDNNPQERLLRNPVIGRKTWYGTHSKRGAETAAILFSLVESCKLNQVNPRDYFKKLVQDLHKGKNAYTPNEYKDLYPAPTIPTM
jgi:transposase